MEIAMKKEIIEEFKRLKNDYQKGQLKRHIPNMLTASRLLSPFILIPLIYYEKLTIALIMVVIFALTDTFDGYLARKYNYISPFGKHLDVLSDKIFALSLLIPLILKNNFLSNFNYLLYFIVLFEILISTINYLAYLKNKDINSTKIGKLKTVVLFFLIAFFYLNKVINIKSNYLIIFIILTISLQIMTLFSYFFQIKKKQIITSSCKS